MLKALAARYELPTDRFRFYPYAYFKYYLYVVYKINHFDTLQNFKLKYHLFLFPLRFQITHQDDLHSTQEQKP